MKPIKLIMYLLALILIFVLFRSFVSDDEEHKQTPAVEESESPKETSNLQKKDPETQPKKSSNLPKKFPETSPEENPSELTKILSSEPCGQGATCHTFSVTCQGLSAREVFVKEYGTQKPPVAYALFTTGGNSTGLYTGQERRKTVQTLLNVGYGVFEIAWKPPGWHAGIDGAGFNEAMCGYAEVVHSINDKLIVNTSAPICAQGNSSGAIQIAHGLSAYELENIFDMVVLSGGPPSSRLDVGCFGSENPELVDAIFPPDAAGRGLTDIAMGWARNGDYCKRGEGSEEARQRLADTSLISSTDVRDYHFPNTKVNFLEADGIPFDVATGRLYFDKITSPKAFFTVTSNEHEVDGTKVGAQKIQELFLNECYPGE